MKLSFEELTELKVGEVFFECDSGVNLTFSVTVDPVISKCDISGKEHRQVAWTANNVASGKDTIFMVTEGLEHYGPKIYRTPQYVAFKDGEMKWS